MWRIGMLLFIMLVTVYAADPLPQQMLPDTAAVTDTSHQQPLAKKATLITRSYNYKHQIVLAAGMMTFIAVMMSSAQAWNPR